MGRTAKTVTISKEDVNEASVEKVMQENEVLKNQLATMMAMIQDLQKAQAAPVVTQLEVTEDLKRRIKVTSITTGGVNMKTANEGYAKTFRLERFGDSVRMMYEDLLNCINTDRWLFTDGYVYINDAKAIEEQDLEDVYKHFLTADKITHIMEFENEDIREMMSNSTRAIQETICQIICEKINKRGIVDLNKVKVIGESCNPPIDILSLAEKLA